MGKRVARKGAKTSATRQTLSPREALFVHEYLIDLNAARAARAAGYAVSTAEGKAASWVKHRDAKPLIFDAVEAGMKDRAKNLGITKSKVLAMWWQIATANPAEIAKIKKVNCRHCHGENFNYQWVDMAEFAETVIRHAGKGITAPDHSGGFGFSPNRPPNKLCPRCAGEGYDRIFLADTDTLSPGALALFEGVSQTDSGRIKLHLGSRTDALKEVGKHIGFYAPTEGDLGTVSNPMRVLYEQICNRVMPVTQNDPDYDDED